MNLVHARMFTATIIVNPKTGYGDGGFPTYGSSANYTGRVHKKRTVSKDKGGEEFVSGTIVLIDSAYTPALGDKITLPDSSTPEMLWFEQGQNQHNNTDHWKLFLL